MQMRLNSEELAALEGMPFFVRCVYLFAIRMHMDYGTGMVGVRRRISWQSMAEALYVEPHQGVTDSGTPAKARIRRAVDWLLRAGVIEARGDGKHLIFYCPHATTDSSEQEKPGTNPARTRHSQGGTEPDTPETSSDGDSHEKPGTEPGTNPAPLEQEKPGKPPESGNRERTEGPDGPMSSAARRVLEHLNAKAGRNYQPVKANVEFVTARFKEGFTEQQLCQVIDRKVAEWGGNGRMQGYLRPATLFRRTNFAQYVGELSAPIPSGSASQFPEGQGHRRRSGFDQIDYEGEARAAGFRTETEVEW